MSGKTRVRLTVLFIATAAAGLTVAATLLAAGDRDAAQTPARPEGARAPQLLLDLGVRSDAEAVALRRASRLYDRGRREAAARIFARYRSLEARVGAALAGWPLRTLERLERLRREHPRSSLVHLHLGLALRQAGHGERALAALRAALRVAPDSASALAAADVLYPRFAPGVPVFVPSFSPPAGLARLSPAGQLAALARRARQGGVRPRLLYGVALQRLGRQLSARRQYDAAAARAPRDPEAQVAAAVARFDKRRPAEAFSRLGPLVRRFPRAATVRFHLGLLLLWLAQADEGKRQLALARALAPRSALGREADRFLRGLSE